MGRRVNQKVFLYSIQSPRSSALMERINKACDGNAIPALIESIEHFPVGGHKKTPPGSVVFLDLPNIKKSAVQTIKSVKSRIPGMKALAVHIYTTKLLIEPLIDAGASGYLTYEPTVAELRDALKSVREGEIYLPDQIYG